MQISSDFYTALKVSENSIIILIHLSTMVSRWCLWTPEWTDIKQKIFHIRHRVHHCTSGELMSFMSSGMWNVLSHLQYMDIARDLLQQHCFVPDFEEFVIFCCKFPDELLCVTTLIRILSISFLLHHIEHFNIRQMTKKKKNKNIVRSLTPLADQIKSLRSAECNYPTW